MMGMLVLHLGIIVLLVLLLQVFVVLLLFEFVPIFR